MPKSKELSDKNSRGQERPWKKHKITSQKIVALLYLLNDSDRAKRAKFCATKLVFNECPNGHGKWLKQANFCQLRVCPLCVWRKGLFTYLQFIQVAHKVIETHPNTQFIFLTLTIKNCELDELSKTLTRLNKSFAKFVKYKRIREAYKGFFKSIETTYNPETNTFHPHIHCVVAVNKNYFTSRNYVKFKELQLFWKKSLKVDYDPDCDFRKVKPKKKKNINTINEDILMMDKELMNQSLIQGGAEAAKYSVKVNDIINPTIWKDDSFELREAKRRLADDQQWQAEVLSYLMSGIDGRQLIGYTGIFRDAYKALNCAEVEESDLIHMPGDEDSCTCKICQSELIQGHYLWNGKGYFEASIKSNKRGKAAGREIERQKHRVNPSIGLDWPEITQL